MSEKQNSSQSGKRVIDFRTKHGWSQETLAERAGYSRNYISMIERGEKEPSPRFWRDLEHAELVARTSEQSEQSAVLTEDVPSYPVTGARARLRSARVAAGLSLPELSRRANVAVGYIQNLEHGMAPITESVARRLCKALPDLEPDDLLSGSDSAPIVDDTGQTGTYGAEPMIELPEGMKARYVPLLSYAQAGATTEWTDDVYSHEGVLAMNLPRTAKAFAISVRGDSMEPRIMEGDQVIVLRSASPANGQIVVACLHSGEVMCKIFNTPDAERVILTSYNSALHPPVELRRDQIRWVFPVHSVTRQILR